MTISTDWNKNQLKNWQFCGDWKLPFCDHRAIKLTQNCVYSFTNPCINLLAPPSVTRKYHPKVLELLHLLQCIAAHSVHCLEFLERHNISVFLVLTFIPTRSHAADNRSNSCWRPCWEDASNTKSSAKSEWLILELTNVTPSRLGLSYLFNLCRLWREVVTPCWSPTPTVNGRDSTLPTRTQTSEQDLTASNRQPSTQYHSKTPQSFSPGRMLYRVRQKMCRRFWHTPKISQISAGRVKFWSVVLRPGRKPHWVSFSFSSIISRHFFQGTWQRKW